MNQQVQTFVLPCEASNLTGRLKHSYLTNAVCLKRNPEKLLAALNYIESGAPRHTIIRKQIRELLDLMATPEGGFSPAQLLDQLNPYCELPDQVRQRMKERIHRQFVEEFSLAVRCDRLEHASEGFLTALDVFLAHNWAAGSASDIIMQKTQEAARALIRELEYLPKGIWLWRTWTVKDQPIMKES